MSKFHGIYVKESVYSVLCLFKLGWINVSHIHQKIFSHLCRIILRTKIKCEIVNWSVGTMENNNSKNVKQQLILVKRTFKNVVGIKTNNFV